MRISNSMIAKNSINGIQGNLSRLARSQEQISTSRRVLRPSDDPIVMGQLMAVRNTLSYNEQYSKNIEDGLSYMDLADTTMGTLGNILKKASEYAVQGANETYTEEQRGEIAEQIDKLIDHVVELANSTVGGRYIYAGMDNDSPPFERVDDTIIYKGDFEPVMREVAAGTEYRVDASGVTTSGTPGVFGTATDDSGTYKVYDKTLGIGDGVFKVLFDLRDNLNNDDTEGIETSIADLETATNDLLKHRTSIGARADHFENLQTDLLNMEVNLTDTMDRIEGADIAELSILVAQQDLAYNASLSVVAQIMQTSILNFLN